MKLIDQQRNDHDVKLLCEQLKIDSSSYYRYLRKTETEMPENEQSMGNAIRESYDQSRKTYGRKIKDIHLFPQKRSSKILY